jgi:hypothetical protein
LSHDHKREDKQEITSELIDYLKRRGFNGFQWSTSIILEFWELRRIPVGGVLAT